MTVLTKLLNGTTEQSVANHSGIPPGLGLEYRFNVGDQVGTYWLHTHIKGQYPNGLRTPFIIKDPDSPYYADHETVLSVSDWVFIFSSQFMVV